MATVAERVSSAVAPVLVDLGLDLYDVEHTGGSLRVLVDRDGGVDLEAVTTATKRISRLLDEVDPVAGAYTLEVSSPGLERPLRTAAHYRRAIGSAVTVKAVPGVEPRRLQGTLVAADDESATVRLDDGAEHRLGLHEIERARTTFAWGPAPKPGKGPSEKKAPR